MSLRLALKASLAEIVKSPGPAPPPPSSTASTKGGDSVASSSNEPKRGPGRPPKNQDSPKAAASRASKSHNKPGPKPKGGGGASPRHKGGPPSSGATVDSSLSGSWGEDEEDDDEEEEEEEGQPKQEVVLQPPPQRKKPGPKPGSKKGVAARSSSSGSRVDSPTEEVKRKKSAGGQIMVVGARVKVKFEGGRWYGGEVLRIDEATGQQVIHFGNGDQEAFDLKDKDVILDVSGGELATEGSKSPILGAKRISSVGGSGAGGGGEEEKPKKKSKSEHPPAAGKERKVSAPSAAAPLTKKTSSSSLGLPPRGPPSSPKEKKRKQDNGATKVKTEAEVNHPDDGSATMRPLPPPPPSLADQSDDDGETGGERATSLPTPSAISKPEDQMEVIDSDEEEDEKQQPVAAKPEKGGSVGSSPTKSERKPLPEGIIDSSEEEEGGEEEEEDEEVEAEEEEEEDETRIGAARSSGGKKKGGEGRKRRKKVELKWVSCDRCGKWRRLPPNSPILPEQWWCSLNDWDIPKASCQAPEDTYDNDDDEEWGEGGGSGDEMATTTTNNVNNEDNDRRKKEARGGDGGEKVRRKPGPKPGHKSAAKQLLQQEQQQQPQLPLPTSPSGKSVVGANGRKPLSAKDFLTARESDKHIQLLSSPEEKGGGGGSSTGGRRFPGGSPTSSTSVSRFKDLDAGAKSRAREKGAAMAARLGSSSVLEAGISGGAMMKTAAGRVGIGGGTASSAGTKEEEKRWVQCDSCTKWREVPRHINVKALPDTWYCTMATWTTIRLTCDSPEDEDEEATAASGSVVVAPPLIAALPQPSPRSSQARSGGSVKGHVAREVDERDWAMSGDSLGGNSGRTGDGGGIARGSSNSSTGGGGNKRPRSGTAPSDVWGIPAGSSGGKRSSSMAGLVGEEVPSGKRNSVAGISSAAAAAASTVRASASSASLYGPGVEIKETQWVQCEACKKWRKLPDFVNADDLPEQWFCDMNKWDPFRNHCDAVEEVFKDQTVAGRGAGGSLLTGGSHKHSNKPSWRDMIFGADGRVRSHFSERGTQAMSVFTARNPRDQSHGKEGVFIRSTAYRAPQNSRLFLMTKLPQQGLLEAARRVYRRAASEAWKANGPSSEMADELDTYRRAALERHVVIGVLTDAAPRQLKRDDLLAVIHRRRYAELVMESVRMAMCDEETNGQRLDETLELLVADGAVLKVEGKKIRYALRSSSSSSSTAAKKAEGGGEANAAAAAAAGDCVVGVGSGEEKKEEASASKGGGGGKGEEDDPPLFFSSRPLKTRKFWKAEGLFGGHNYDAEKAAAAATSLGEATLSSGEGEAATSSGKEMAAVSSGGGKGGAAATSISEATVSSGEGEAATSSGGGGKGAAAAITTSKGGEAAGSDAVSAAVAKKEKKGREEGEEQHKRQEEEEETWKMEVYKPADSAEAMQSSSLSEAAAAPIPELPSSPPPVAAAASTTTTTMIPSLPVMIHQAAPTTVSSRSGSTAGEEKDGFASPPAAANQTSVDALPVIVELKLPQPSHQHHQMSLHCLWRLP